MRIHLLLLIMALGFNAIAQQAPQKINYQAVVRSATGDPVINQNVSLRFSILEGSAGGATLYSETHSVATNAFGLANIQIGGGTPVSGTFNTIDWGSAAKFLKIEADITGGTTYTNLSTVEMVSAPYALNAQTSNDNRWDLAATNITNNNTGNVGIGGTPDANAKLDISATNKGILIPRLTQSNRPTAPTEGLLVYQTDNTPGFYYYNSGSWKRIANQNDLSSGGGTVMGFSSGTNNIQLSSSNWFALGLGSFTSFASFAGPSVNQAFSMPRNGTLTAISGNFTLISPPSISAIETGIISVQLYTASATSSTFSPVPGASIALSPGLTSFNATTGFSIAGVNSGLSIPLIAGNRYVLCFTITGTAATVSGYPNAGISIQ